MTVAEEIPVAAAFLCQLRTSDRSAGKR